MPSTELLITTRHYAGNHDRCVTRPAVISRSMAGAAVCRDARLVVDFNSANEDYSLRVAV